jgi:hypothetical protein
MVVVLTLALVNATAICSSIGLSLTENFLMTDEISGYHSIARKVSGGNAFINGILWKFNGWNLPFQ